MAFKQIERVKIDGSPKIFGGTIYNMSFNRSVGTEPFTLSVDIVSSTGEYTVNDEDLQYNSSHVVAIGDLSLNMYLDGYFPQISGGQRVMRLEFIDTSILLDSIYIGLPYVHLDPNVSSNKILLVKNSEGNFVTRQDLEIQKLTDTMTLEYDFYGNLIGSQAALKQYDLLMRKDEFLPDYIYNIQMLLDTITAAGITIDLNDIDLTKYEKYYVNNTGTMRSVLSSILQEFGLSFIWFNEQIVLLDLTDDISADVLREYIQTLEFIDISGYSESVSIRNNVNRVSSVTYRQEGGEYNIERANRRRKFFRIEPEDLGVENNAGYFIKGAEVTPPGAFTPRQRLYWADAGAKDKYIIRKAHTLWNNNNLFSAFAATSDRERFQYFYTYESNPSTVESLDVIKGFLKDAASWTFAEGDVVIHNLKKLPSEPNIEDENYLDFFGRFYARKGRLRDDFEAQFYYSETPVYETVFKDFFKDDSPKLNWTIKQLFATNLNVTLFSNPTAWLFKGRQTKQQNLHGVWIKVVDIGQRWKYQTDITSKIVTASTLKELFENSLPITQAINKIEKGCFYLKSPNKGHYENMNLNEPYLIHKNLYDSAEGTLVSQIVDKVELEAVAAPYILVHSQGNLENVDVSYAHKQVSQQYGEINSADKTRLEVNTFEVVPDDVFIEYGLVEQEIPPAATVQRLYTNNQIVAVSENYAEEAAFKQDFPSVEISFQTSTINQLTLSKTLFKYLKGFNLSMDENGYKMDYVFGNNFKQLVNPEVGKQNKYWTMRSIYGQNRWTSSTRPNRTDMEFAPISYPDNLLGNF